MSLMGERAGAQAGVRVGGRVCGRAGRWAGGVGDVLLVRVGGVALLQCSIWRLEFIASRRVRAARLSALSRAASSPAPPSRGATFPRPSPGPAPSLLSANAGPLVFLYAPAPVMCRYALALEPPAESMVTAPAPASVQH